MLLAIDIGNTHVSLCIFKNNIIAAQWKLSSWHSHTEDECWMSLLFFCKQAQLSTSEITGAVISSVVPSQTEIYQRMVKKYLRIKSVNISGVMDIGIKIRYRDSSAVGADRLCGVVAAYQMFGGPAIVIDWGTATTFDVISKQGEYLGGAIAPGIETASAELYRRTAKLPKIELKFPSRIIADNTVAGMQAGIMFGGLDAMEGIVKRIQRELGSKTKVIATGGLAQVIASKSKLVQYIEPNLVLHGARLIYEYVVQHSARRKH